MNTFNIDKHLQMIERELGVFYRQFHHFERVIKEWKIVFGRVDDTLRKATQARVTSPNGDELVSETFTQELVFAEDKVFIFEWDIVLAFYELQQRKVSPQKINLLPYLPFIDTTQLNFEQKENQQPYLPVILLDAHEVLQTHIVLNGNHRMVEAYQKGKLSINGYYIKDLSHLRWMTSDKMQAMYEFLSDMRMIDWVITNQGSHIKHNSLYEKLFISKLYPKLKEKGER